jgi:hypothetical protein
MNAEKETQVGRLANGGTVRRMLTYALADGTPRLVCTSVAGFLKVWDPLTRREVRPSS